MGALTMFKLGRYRSVENYCAIALKRHARAGYPVTDDLLLELKNDYTIVIVTHNMQQAARVSDFTAFMENGVLIEYGPTETLFTNPENQRTEEYVTGRFG